MKGMPEYKEALGAQRELEKIFEQLRYTATKNSIGKDWIKKRAFKDIETQFVELSG